MKAKPLSRQVRGMAEKYLRLNPSSPSGLSYADHWDQTKLHLVGTSFGSKDPRGYWTSPRAFGQVKVHNLIYWLAYECDPALCHPFTVDHKDQDKSNNSLDNLRLATKREQSKNRELKPSSSGFKWVCTRTLPSGTVRYVGRYRTKKGQVFVGQFRTAEEAYKAVLVHRGIRYSV